MMKKLVIGSVLTVALGSGALAAMGGMSWIDSLGLRGEKRQVMARVANYWEARKAGDLEKMVQFLHPLQGSIPEAGMLVTEGFQLHDVTVEGDVATANLTVHSRLKHPIFSKRERTLEVNTQWVRYEGQWYKALAPVGIADTIKHFQGRWTPPAAAVETVDQ